ncbi:CIR protein PIR protein [Plasmodium vinckei brucechwatti]|uniref:CIR protein PIR protein n=1 Tax=Plasmodium vinckei brucechwatti TaxID=119398 RepID=A0A6V7RVP3_PLAVN|nr:CIR protein PIR protein [Plasmodium vinckei brucechwatti]
MAQSPYSIKDVYKAIITINNYFKEGPNGSATVSKNNGSIHDYCHYRSTTGKGKCNDYFELTSSSVIQLLKTLKGMPGLECEQLAEYAILWLSYKLNQHSNHKNKSANLNDFYTKYIETNNDYNKKINGDGSPTYKEIINKKKDLMNIKEIFHFDTPFSLLCNLYKMTNDAYLFCNYYLDHATRFAASFKLRNQQSNNIEGSSYNKILSTLSDDYKNIKKKCVKFPSLQELNPKKVPVVNSEQPTALSSEVTSSSSSISTTLIPGLSTFSVIPVFLGIAYKYSLFGIDKLFQRQYIRKKLKKVKKSMKLNI